MSNVTAHLLVTSHRATSNHPTHFSRHPAYYLVLIHTSSCNYQYMPAVLEGKLRDAALLPGYPASTILRCVCLVFFSISRTFQFPRPPKRFCHNLLGTSQRLCMTTNSSNTYWICTESDNNMGQFLPFESNPYVQPTFNAGVISCRKFIMGKNMQETLQLYSYIYTWYSVPTLYWQHLPGLFQYFPRCVGTLVLEITQTRLRNTRPGKFQLDTNSFAYCTHMQAAAVPVSEQVTARFTASFHCSTV